jgi:hypothetical protein
LSTSQRLTLLPARDEWKSAIFDFVAPSTTLYTRLYALCPTGGGTGGGKVWFDGLTLKRIYRWELHEGRMSYEALPTINEGRSGIFFDRWTIGQGSVSLVNGNDYFENLFGTYEVANAEARILLGGRFPDGGNEILTGDMMVRRWTARKPTVSDSEAHLDLDDPRQILLEVLPKRRDELPDWPDMAPVDNGRPVPMIFGAVPVQIGHPARVGVTSDGYGIYHVLDERYLVNMTSMISGVYSFTSEEAADKNVLTERISNSQWTYGVTTGLLTITGDIRPIRISRGVTDLIDAVVDGVAKVAKVDTYGLPSDSLATIKNHLAIRIQNALDDVGAGRTYTVSYSDTTHLVTIQQNAGTFVMSLTSAAPNRDRSLCPLIGFDENVDRTGGLTYTGESALFDDLDKQHIVRAAVFGYLDDTSGTYTGSAAAEISKPGDVLYFLLHKVLGVPVEQIDLASVAAVRSGADALRMYLGISREDEHEFGQIVEWIENSNGIQLLQDGDLWKLRKRASTLQATAATLYDRDFLSFDSWYDEADLASIVRIDYGQDPSTGEMPSYTVSDQTSGHVLGADVQLGRLRLGREKSMSFQTYLPDTASAWLPKMVYNAMARRRRFSFSVKGTCFRSGPEDQVVIARTTFAGRTTAAPTCLARILEVTRDPKTYVSTIQAVEILSGTYGW